MHYFSNKFSRIAKRCGGSPPPASVNLPFWWSEVAWLSQIVGFQTNCNKTVMTSLLWRHRYYVAKNVTKLTSQDFWTPSFQFVIWTLEILTHRYLFALAKLATDVGIELLTFRLFLLLWSWDISKTVITILKMAFWRF